MSKKLHHDSLGLPKAIVGYIYNNAAKNYWRVAAWYDLDDLIQDGLMVAYKCRERYGTDIDPPHFMALVQSSFFNHIGDLLRHSRPEQEITNHIGDLVGEGTEDQFLDRVADQGEPVQEFAALISKMPRALRDAVTLYLNSPEKLRSKRVLLYEDEHTQEKKLLHKLAGFPLRFDFETELRAYLWECDNVEA